MNRAGPNKSFPSFSLYSIVVLWRFIEPLKYPCTNDYALSITNRLTNERRGRELERAQLDSFCAKLDCSKILNKCEFGCYGSIVVILQNVKIPLYAPAPAQ